jgi:hypothetical protein
VFSLPSTRLLQDVVDRLALGAISAANARRLRSDWHEYRSTAAISYGTTSLRSPEPTRDSDLMVTRAQSLRTIQRKGHGANQTAHVLNQLRKPDTSCLAVVDASDDKALAQDALVWVHTFSVRSKRGRSGRVAALVDATGVPDNVRHRTISRFLAFIVIPGQAAGTSSPIVT